MSTGADGQLGAVGNKEIEKFYYNNRHALVRGAGTYCGKLWPRLQDTVWRGQRGER